MEKTIKQSSKVKFIKKTTNQKCSCGYEYLREEKLKVERIPDHFITREPGIGPVVHNHTTKTETLSTEILKGEEMFIYIVDNLMACPKCGTILLRSIAEKITEEE